MSYNKGNLKVKLRFFNRSSSIVNALKLLLVYDTYKPYLIKRLILRSVANVAENNVP